MNTKKQLQRVGVYVFFFLLLVLGLVSIRLSTKTSWSTENLRDRQQITLLVQESGRKLRVEVVMHPESISQGLSGRSQMGSDGMLFIFPQTQQAVFWMKEMQFDLDLVWIRAGAVVGVTPAYKPTPGTALSDLVLYPAPSLVDSVLEVPLGMAQQYGLQQGVRVELLE